MLQVITSLGADTHAHTHARTHAHTHTHTNIHTYGVQIETILRNQVCACHRPAHAWFKNKAYVVKNH